MQLQGKERRKMCPISACLARFKQTLWVECKSLADREKKVKDKDYRCV